MRLMCAWCGRALDGLGPVVDPDNATHGICVACAWLAGARGADTRWELELLRTALGRGPATKGWTRRIGYQLVRLELTGGTHFGAGSPRPDVIAYWLTQRVLHDGWDYLKVTRYVSELVSERLGAAA